jgi:hypothetical protein
MNKILYFITGLPFIIGGLFFSLYSKRLALSMLQSTVFLNSVFNRKRSFSKSDQIILQIFLTIFGILLVLVGIKCIAEAAK